MTKQEAYRNKELADKTVFVVISGSKAIYRSTSTEDIEAFRRGYFLGCNGSISTAVVEVNVPTNQWGSQYNAYSH